MKRIVGAIIASAVLSGPALAADLPSRGAREPMLGGVHESYDGQASRGLVAPAQQTREQKAHGHHRHRVTAIIVFVPAIGWVNVPYYYSPTAPVYAGEDPPDDAYREPSGFFYWCPNPPGYYPDQPDCPVGWRLVAP